MVAWGGAWSPQGGELAQPQVLLHKNSSSPNRWCERGEISEALQACGFVGAPIP